MKVGLGSMKNLVIVVYFGWELIYYCIGLLGVLLFVLMVYVCVVDGKVVVGVGLGM